MASFKKAGNLFKDSSQVCLFMYTLYRASAELLFLCRFVSFSCLVAFVLILVYGLWFWLQ